MKLVTRKEKERMFVREYYFGYGFLGSINRIILGPVLVFAGIYLLVKNAEEYDWIYAILCLLFGLMSIIKPYLAVAANKKGFGEENLNVTVDKENINIEDSKNYVSKLSFDSIMDIKERKTYLAIIFNKKQRIQIPKRLFSEKALNIIRQKYS